MNYFCDDCSNKLLLYSWNVSWRFVCIALFVDPNNLWILNNWCCLEPIGGEITVASESALHKYTPKTAKENALDEQLKASRFSTPSDTSHARGCYYTSIPHVIKHRGIDGQQLTSLNLDKVPPLVDFFFVQFFKAYLAIYFH